MALKTYTYDINTELVEVFGDIDYSSNNPNWESVQLDDDVTLSLYTLGRGSLYYRVAIGKLEFVPIANNSQVVYSPVEKSIYSTPLGKNYEVTVDENGILETVLVV